MKKSEKLTELLHIIMEVNEKTAHDAYFEIDPNFIISYVYVDGFSKSLLPTIRMTSPINRKVGYLECSINKQISTIKNLLQ